MAKILVIEDNEQIGELLTQRLQRRGHTILLADKGDQGVESARVAQPDLIVIDLDLRGVEGWEAARAIKFDSHTRHIPMLGLTDGSEDARNHATQVGCDMNHAKPIDFVQLLQQIDKFGGERDDDEAKLESA